MAREQENCNSTPGPLLVDSGEVGGLSAISPPADLSSSSVGHPDEPLDSSEVVLCVTSLPQEAETVEENTYSEPTKPEDRYDWEWYDKLARPRTYGDCLNLHLGSEHRPCPFVSCEHHLMFRIVDGKIVLNYGTDDIDKLPFTCAAHEASGDTITLEAIGQRLNISKERVRQLQNEAIRKLQDGRQEPLREFEFWTFERSHPEEDT